MKTILATAHQRLSEARSMLTDVHRVDATGNFERDLAERSMMSNACFLSVFIGLEEFFEASFVHYLGGRMSTTRWRPSKYGRPPTAAHAHQMLIGTQRFVDWSTPSTVLKLADLYFDGGEPFRTPIASSTGHLQRMKTVRNATAHVSVTTQAALDAVYSSWTGTPRVGVTAYETLMSYDSSGSDSFYGFTDNVVRSIMNDIATRS